jgi:hypothetical protein
MTALTMIAQCAAAQWRGLPAADRARLTLAWERADLPAASTLRAPELAPQQERPIWTVSHALGHSLTLLSVKDDLLA